MSVPLFLFAHGAGAPSTSSWMQRWAQHLAQHGKVESFDYPYMQAGRRAPDRLVKLVAAHRDALHQVRRGHRGPIVLIGKSMGGRVGCHVALEETVQALVCLGYPLKGMGKTGKLRDEVLLQLRTPILFVQGTRDSLCPLDVLETVRGRMKAKHALHVVESGNHSLEATKTHLKASGTTQAKVEAAILAAIADFLAVQAAEPHR